MVTKHHLMIEMEKHTGKNNGVHVKQLAATLEIPERGVRVLVTQCREDGIAICGHPATGYFIAETPEDLQVTLDFLKERALHSLKLASTLSKIPLADLVGQLHLRT